MLDINVKGTFFSFKYAATQLLKQGTGGRMIGAASVASKRGLSPFRLFAPVSPAFSLSSHCPLGFPQHAAYCASKFAVRALTQCAAMDYGKHGITVNAYAPGAIETFLRESTLAWQPTLGMLIRCSSR